MTQDNHTTHDTDTDTDTDTSTNSPSPTPSSEAQSNPTPPISDGGLPTDDENPDSPHQYIPNADNPTVTRFEDLDWQTVDNTRTLPSVGSLLWTGFLFVWVGILAGDLAFRFLLSNGDGRLVVPVLGTVSGVTWLWVFTIATILYYGARPLLRNRRMAAYYWRQFKQNTAAVISAIYLSALFILGTIGTFFIPTPTNTPSEQSLPPVWGSVEAFVTGGSDCPGGYFRSDTGEQLGTVKRGSDYLSSDGTVQATARELPQDATVMCSGSMDHIFGTTTGGKDIARSIVHGTRVTLQVSLIATMLSILIAIAVALTAAYYGGFVDELLTRYIDLQMTFPSFFLFLLLAYTVGGSLLVLILIFGAFGWGATARIVRAEALQRRQEPYMDAARAAGASPLWTMRKHLLPNVSNSLITAASLAIPSLILTEAAISFIGLTDSSVTSWGRLIADGRAVINNAWWISTLPGIVLFLTVLAFNFLGDALRDSLDPRHDSS